MSVSYPTIWWVIAGLLVAAELFSTTFYMLVLALGAAAGAIAAHFGLSLPAQIVVFCLVGGGGTALWHFKRARAPRSAPVASNRDAQMDIGGRVRVERWEADRSSAVLYRGATWTARLRADGPAEPGEHEIVAVEGNHLIVARAQPR
ncbi:NfeD family protein [Rivibacter subsaxonicus]|uniref:Membrane protein implicated in regulation of membrane protease activity n=1 Tax=Rivibacter subsaxonicus TaxID=457575 RepID=A0A4Q7VD82_9BURK|nr:NfeD family protein [Rivibacter subsaxonicus]RZT93857.1 membrane protein implicated in regulation of membrane protease activity [Rivibacter subsaxonicus]